MKSIYISKKIWVIKRQLSVWYVDCYWLMELFRMGL